MLSDDQITLFEICCSVHNKIGGNPVGGGVVGHVREKEIEVAGRQERGSMEGGASGVTGR